MHGGMLEWPNRHDWKSCKPQGFVGSNPTPSAGCESTHRTIRGPLTGWQSRSVWRASAPRSSRIFGSSSPRDGLFVDTLGHYNPKSDPPQYTLDEERARLWLSRGAEPTMAAARV